MILISYALKSISPLPATLVYLWAALDASQLCNLIVISHLLVSQRNQSISNYRQIFSRLIDNKFLTSSLMFGHKHSKLFWTPSWIRNGNGKCYLRAVWVLTKTISLIVSKQKRNVGELPDEKLSELEQLMETIGNLQRTRHSFAHWNFQ